MEKKRKEVEKGGEKDIKVIFLQCPYASFLEQSHLYPHLFAEKPLIKGDLGNFQRLNIPTPFAGNIF